MRSRSLRLAVTFTIAVASLMLYPNELRADLCSMHSYSYEYWDYPDPNGNCPVNHHNLVGYFELMCSGNVIQWGIQGGCDVVYTQLEYCGDCQQEW